VILNHFNESTEPSVAMLRNRISSLKVGTLVIQIFNRFQSSHKFKDGSGLITNEFTNSTLTLLEFLAIKTQLKLKRAVKVLDRRIAFSVVMTRRNFTD
jgi:hypothetical protein